VSSGGESHDGHDGSSRQDGGAECGSGRGWGGQF
jgi:hypothetical protein